MIEKKSALLVGASGLVGSELLKYLLDAKEYEKINVFVRNPLNIEHPKLQQIVTDFDQLDNYMNYCKVNDVYCCLGTTIKKAGTQESFKKVDYEYPVKLARMAKETGVQKFLMITALGADADSKIFYSRVKGEVEERIKSENLPALLIFRPSLLLGKRSEFRFGEKLSIIMSPVYSIWMVGALRKYRPIQAKAVAVAMYRGGQQNVEGTIVYESDQIVKISKED